MSKHGRTKLVPLETKHKEQTLESLEEINQPEQTEQPKSELDIEIECPRCNEIMDLYSKFDEMIYFCESCSFVLKCA
jgi:hypothetical protein